MKLSYCRLEILMFKLCAASAFSQLAHNSRTACFQSSSLNVCTPDNANLEAQKKNLLDLLLISDPAIDPHFADPITKEPLRFQTKPAVLGSNIAGRRLKIELRSSSSIYTGSSDSFIDLLVPVSRLDCSDKEGVSSTWTAKSDYAFKSESIFLPFIPPPFRSALATFGLLVNENYVPMRDLFTSPSVSFAYERGWRQGFAAAGFPGPEEETKMAMDYFESALGKNPAPVLVDMSCATGLFTRRFAKLGKFKRILGCDYSQSMLIEARQRIERDSNLRHLKNTTIDLVRLDVGQIPLQNESVDAVNAGAAMHCWPDLPAAVSEIHRILKPGGRYFATTFLSSYFENLQKAESGATGPSRQAFQYFESIEQLFALLQFGGFEREKISIEILGAACVVIRCEK